MFTIFFFLLTLFQLRFGYFFMMGYSLMLGISFKELLESRLKYVLMLFIIISSVIFFRDYKTSEERFIDSDLAKGLVFLRDHTPEKSSFDNFKTPYGILSSWHLGHYIIEIAKRPVTAHNFINVALNNGEKEFMRALFSENESEVLEIMSRNNSKFLFLDNPNDLIVTDWYAINRGENPYTDGDKKINLKAQRLFIYRLYHFDGLTPPFLNSTKHFRLIYESSLSPFRVKIFERVEGAKILYNGKDSAILKARIKTPYREFFYVTTGEALDGKRIFHLPYSSDSNYPVKAEYINFETGTKKIELNINEQDVISGKTIYIFH